MRKSILLFLFFAVTTQAQPVLNAADFPATYSADAYTAPTTGFTNGGSGADQVWDYSTMNLTPANYSYSIVPSETIPLASSFPTANYSYRFNDNGLIFFNMQKLQANSFESLGYIDGNFALNYLDTNLVFEFPYTYNSFFTDTYLPDYPDAELQTITRTYDSYGTLITPFGTFNDVMRQKVEQNGQIGYIWFTNNPFQIIVSGNFENQYVYFWKDTTNLSTNPVSKSVFMIYPNPTTGDFTIYCNNNLNKETFATVYDVLGKIVLPKQKMTNEIQTINSSKFTSGLYIVKITDSDNQLLQTEKIIKN
jgi:Secretion system C-terminal sorting domain